MATVAWWMMVTILVLLIMAVVRRLHACWIHMRRRTGPLPAGVDDSIIRNSCSKGDAWILCQTDDTDGRIPAVMVCPTMDLEVRLNPINKKYTIIRTGTKPTVGANNDDHKTQRVVTEQQ
jgi:hypothetical protein